MALAGFGAASAGEAPLTRVVTEIAKVLVGALTAPRANSRSSTEIDCSDCRKALAIGWKSGGPPGPGPGIPALTSSPTRAVRRLRATYSGALMLSARQVRIDLATARNSFTRSRCRSAALVARISSEIGGLMMGEL